MAQLEHQWMVWDPSEHGCKNRNTKEGMCFAANRQAKIRARIARCFHVIIHTKSRSDRRHLCQVGETILTPSQPPPVKFPGWMMHGRTCKQYIFRSSNIYFQFYAFWWRSFHMQVRKTKIKRLYGFQISHFYGSFSDDTMAVKGLRTACRKNMTASLSQVIQRDLLLPPLFPSTVCN